MNKRAQQFKRPSIAWGARRNGIRNHWFFLVWLAACLAAAWLYQRHPFPDSPAFIRGVVDEQGVSLSAVETARIRKIRVVEGQRVKAGDLIVEMDTALIAHGVTSDLLDSIRIEAAFGDTHQDVLQAVSQRLDAIASIEAEIAACRQEWAREEALLAALKAEQKKREDLHANRHIDALTRDELLPELSALDKAVALYPERIAMYEKQLGEAVIYYENIMAWLGGSGNEPVSEAIRKRLNEEQVHRLLTQARIDAELHSKAYKIRAPGDGVVSEILFAEGEVVTEEFPIVRIVSGSPEYIRAYLDESQVTSIRVGQKLVVQTIHRLHVATAEATVESISAEVRLGALTLSATGREVPTRNRRARLRIKQPHQLLGGEEVFLRAQQKSIFEIVGQIFSRRTEDKVPMDGPRL